MTLVTQRLSTLTGADGGVAYVEATWDDRQEQEDGSVLDPNATMLVSNVTYQNMTNQIRHANIGGTIYDIPVGTPRTSRDIPRGQQVRIDTIPYFLFY